MIIIHGMSASWNTSKVVYVAEELGSNYAYRPLDVMKQENKTPEHMKRHPFGYLPTLTTSDGRTMFESAAICRYLAAIQDSDLYPHKDHYTAALIDQWIHFSIDASRSLNNLWWEHAKKNLPPAMGGGGDPDAVVVKKSSDDFARYAKAFDDHLDKHPYLVEDRLSLADLFAFAYWEAALHYKILPKSCPNLERWIAMIAERDCVKRGHKILGRGGRGA